ncbi:HNH endonuclease signature motif containing protein [uncultured Clostridium sp.]|jgi:hypothetical protein|uniref:HNH endonuclease n=1 Tax=uncultured Clostridium sp. TaxID=59620 RepID=UPI002619FA30|nr:HNH endonuclease signature motif containing protein [uncultured Clostridium sp.]
MGFSKKVKEQAFLKCKRHCVLCEQKKGINMECHHIKPHAKGGPDTLENCIPVCFDCHAIIGSYNSEHPKGNGYSENELKGRRDEFYERVANNEFPQRSILKDMSQNVKKSDEKIYEEVKDIFKTGNLEYYLTEVDLGNDFDNKEFRPLSELSNLARNPEYEFIDSDLRGAMNNLINVINKFLLYKGKNTFPTSLGTQAIKTWKNYKYTPEESMKINNKFNELADEVWANYCTFVRVFKSKE